MNKIISTISFLLVINTCLMGQASIDFYPKSLKTELKKIKSSNEIELTELQLTSVQARAVQMGKFYTISDQYVFSDVKYVYIGRTYTCRTGGCSINTNNDMEISSEYFDYFILFNASAAIKTVKIYNYQSTHGQEVTATSWLKQFRSYDGKQELVVGKNIDAISGATISVDATAFEIEHKTKLLQNIIQ